MMDRTEALELLRGRGLSPSLTQHSLAAEAVMRALAAHFGEDKELWGLAGLLHDLDFPETAENPERHGLEAAEALAGKLPAEALAAIRAHNGEMNGSEPSGRLDFALRCGESVTGLITAASLMRPTGIEGMEVKSLKKKLKDRAFAASVSRENIRECERAGLGLDEFLLLAIRAMRDSAAELGLLK